MELITLWRVLNGDILPELCDSVFKWTFIADFLIDINLLIVIVRVHSYSVYGDAQVQLTFSQM